MLASSGRIGRIGQPLVATTGAVRFNFRRDPGSALPAGWTLTRGSGATQRGSDGNLLEVAAGVARFTTNTAGVNQGLMREVTRDNPLLYSRDPSDAVWTKLNTGTLTQDQTDAFGVENSAWTVADTDVVNAYSIRQESAVGNNSNPNSIFVRFGKDSDQTRFPEIRVSILGGASTVLIYEQLNTQTGASATRFSQGVVSSNVVDEGSFWVLELFVENNTSGNTTLRLEIFPAFSSTLGGASDGTLTGGVIFDATQTELNASYRTSDIPTLGATVQRDRDVVSYDLSGITQPLDGKVSTTFVPYKAATGAVQVIWEFDQDASNWIQLYLTAAGIPRLTVLSSGAPTSVQLTTALVDRVSVTMEVVVMASGVTLRNLDNGENASSGPITVPSAFTSLLVGQNRTAGDQKSLLLQAWSYEPGAS